MGKCDFSFGCFYTLKTRPKYAKYVIWPKYHFRVAKTCCKGDFHRFRGVIRFIKVVSVFRFGHWKCHFWYPQNRQKGAWCLQPKDWWYLSSMINFELDDQNYAFLAISGVPKMALLMPETENGDHFYKPNYPPKPRKNHLCNISWLLESGILAILHIACFGV